MEEITLSRRFIALGAGALAAGLLLVTVASMPGHTSSVYAGADVCVTFTPTRTPTKTATPGTATVTSTPVPAATSTPVPAATSTPVPAATLTPTGPLSAFGNSTAQKTCVATATTTPAATSTLAVATNTAAPAATATRIGGNLGGGVRPPDTGSGGYGSAGGYGATGSGFSALLIAGIALIALGGGTVLAGVRSRK